tara:strand:- start:52 stop:465 length:414 start_codon:yes stop_codon:yes gene_type:complete
MSDDFISAGVQGVLDHGIDLKLESHDEEIYYTTKMCDFFNDGSDFKAYLSGDCSFEVEIDRDTAIMEVTINDSILNIMPYTEDFFEAFMVVLTFIAREHTALILELRGQDVHRIESPQDVNKLIKEEEDSDDDYEWI